MKEKFAWESEDVIWEVWLDSALGNLVLEVRKPTERSLNFIAIHAELGHVVFDGFDQQPDWWAKTRYAHSGMLVMERYNNPDLPETLGLLAYNYLINSLAWENPFLRFSHAVDQSLCCQTTQQESLWIALIDGEQTTTPTETRESKQFDHVQLLRPDFRSYNDLIAFIVQKSGFTEVQNLYYGEPQSKIMLGFEAQTETNKIQCLWLLNTDGVTLWEKKWEFNHNSQPLIQFFWSENTLFVLENQHLITAYELD